MPGQLLVIHLARMLIRDLQPAVEGLTNLSHIFLSAADDAAGVIPMSGKNPFQNSD